ncbi:hypothetical protein ACSBR1_013938 [Camellia fascicularis]
MELHRIWEFCKRKTSCSNLVPHQILMEKFGIIRGKQSLYRFLFRMVTRLISCNTCTLRMELWFCLSTLAVVTMETISTRLDSIIHEFLTSISGSCHPEKFLTNDYQLVEDLVLTSITFGTNQGSYGPFGEPGEYDTKFNFQMGQDRPFGGFHGSTKHGLLESIGVYVKPL